MTDEQHDTAGAGDAQVMVAEPDVEEPGELLVEEISIDGMCGVY